MWIIGVPRIFKHSFDALRAVPHFHSRRSASVAAADRAADDRAADHAGVQHPTALRGSACELQFSSCAICGATGHSGVVPDAASGSASDLQTVGEWELVGSGLTNPGGTASSSGGPRPLTGADRGDGALDSGNPKAVNRARAAGEISLGRLPKHSPSPESRP